MANLRKQIESAFSGVLWSVVIICLIGVAVFVYDLNVGGDQAFIPLPSNESSAPRDANSPDAFSPDSHSTDSPSTDSFESNDRTWPPAPQPRIGRTGSTMQAECIAVIDGDTIDVLVNQRPLRIRVAGIDCPEKGQAYGNVAKRFTSEFCFRKTVRLWLVELDKYHRQVAWVEVDDKDLSVELLRAGLAWHDRYVPELEPLEQVAREARFGLWRDANPMSPRTWRQQHP